MFAAGVYAHFITSRAAVPLLTEHRDHRPGLIVHTLASGFGAFLGNVIYDTAKAATTRLAFGEAQQLRPHRVAAVAVAPGHLGVTETPEYLGRAVAALAADDDVLARSGALLTVGELAREYGFTDVNGTQPEPWGRTFRPATNHLRRPGPADDDAEATRSGARVNREVCTSRGREASDLDRTVLSSDRLPMRKPLVLSVTSASRRRVPRSRSPSSP
jgi:NAD(P)-dependent dehydrogenase (short-subunit alcohol dehydrogenase family)